jgi:hypothetical protein
VHCGGGHPFTRGRDGLVRERANLPCRRNILTITADASPSGTSSLGRCSTVSSLEGPVIDASRKPNKIWKPLSGWRVADPSELAANPMVVCNNRLLPWDGLPGTVAAKSVDTLRVFTASATADLGLPAYLRQLTRLEDLVIPPQIVPTLRPGMLPDGLKGLRVHDDLNPRVKPARFADGVSFLTIEELTGSMHLVFNPSTFPNLRFLHLCLDRKKTMLARLGSMRTVKALGLSMFNDPAIFELIAGMSLSWLAIYGTQSVETLEGIERLGDLESLRVSEFPRLTSLEPLSRLPSLCELEVCYCNRLSDYEALLRIPSLRSVEFYACDRDAVAAIRPALEAKGIRVHPAGKASG